MSNNPRPIQKLVLVLAVLSYLAAAACGLFAAFWEGSYEDPIFASLLASVVFFVSVGIVLHVIGRTRLPNLKVDR